jgi:hypothetical protein
MTKMLLLNCSVPQWIRAFLHVVMLREPIPSSPDVRDGLANLASRRSAAVVSACGQSTERPRCGWAAKEAAPLLIAYSYGTWPRRHFDGAD